MFLNFSFIFNKPTKYLISWPLHVVFDNIKSDNIGDEWINSELEALVAVESWNLSDMVGFSEQDCIGKILYQNGTKRT